MGTTIQIRRGAKSEWTAANTVLADGELGLEQDTCRFKFGDGVTAWGTLPYYDECAPSSGPTGLTTVSRSNPLTGKGTPSSPLDIDFSALSAADVTAICGKLLADQACAEAIAALSGSTSNLTFSTDENNHIVVPPGGAYLVFDLLVGNNNPFGFIKGVLNLSEGDAVGIDYTGFGGNHLSIGIRLNGVSYFGSALTSLPQYLSGLPTPDTAGANQWSYSENTFNFKYRTVPSSSLLTARFTFIKIGVLPDAP